MTAFSWTGTQQSDHYRSYPPFVNLTGNRLSVRGPEKTDKDGNPEPGDYVSVYLTIEATGDLLPALRSASVAVDDDALVEWLRSHAKYVKSLIGAGKGTLFFDADIEKLNAIADRLQSLQASIRVKDEALRWIEGGAKLGTEMFEQRVRERKDRLTWWAVNVLQDNLAACQGTAKAALSDQQQGDEG